VTKTTPALIEQYRLCAVEHGAATSVGNHRKANRQHDRLLAALKELRTQGEEGSTALLGLLDDESPSVRAWAATHCLKIDEARASAVLEQLAAGTDFVAFDAKVVLAEWAKGTLRTPESRSFD
jgi:hypothetical protein